MWPKILVSFHQLFCKRKKESGSSTILAVMISGVSLATIGSTLSILHDNQKVLKIMRMQNRMDFRKTQIDSAASSIISMRKTAEKAGGGSALSRCFQQGKCIDNGTYRPYTLYNSGGQRLSGLFNFSGKYCKSDCPIEVITQYRLICANGINSCDVPAEIKTKYQIKMRSETELLGRKLKPITGEVSLATFVCEKGEYITGVADNGFLKCEKPIPSIYDLSCPDDTAAFGLALDGTFKCISVVDYCQEAVYFSYVLDTSGSMMRGKLSAAASSGKNVINQLNRGDMASLATFNSSASLLANASTNKNAVANRLNGLRPRGSTNISDGLRQGGNSLNGLTKGAKVLVLLSDGMHNTGNVNPVDVANSFKRKGYRIFSIGFGSDADRSALRQIASSPVDFYEARSSDQLKNAFDSIASVICRK